MDIENDIDYDNKKKYICENIVKLTNHKNYLDIVEFHECPHTNNSNGIFINLNTIPFDVIDKLYYKLKTEIEDDAFNVTIIEKQIIEEEIEELLKENNNKQTKEVYDIIKMEDFTEEECNIITLSKKYKI
tara:strand:- start:205 stop:594 length:390 start_codon:yes stop_codon:yes gene_type:complete